MQMKDYYSILGVSKDADEVVIRAAYKALAQKYHPDKATPELRSSSTVRMTEINEAYAVLCDFKKRSNHDVNQAKQNTPQKETKRHQQKPVTNKENEELKKEMPYWLFSSLLLTVWVIGLYLIFKFTILKN
jgi:DnaJ-class molecular chaperone